MPEIDKGKNNMSENIEIEKINKYQIIADLQTFYKRLIELDYGIDLLILINKFMSFVHTDKILCKIFIGHIESYYHCHKEWQDKYTNFTNKIFNIFYPDYKADDGLMDIIDEIACNSPKIINLTNYKCNYFENYYTPYSILEYIYDVVLKDNIAKKQIEKEFSIGEFECIYKDFDFIHLYSYCSDFLQIKTNSIILLKISVLSVITELIWNFYSNDYDFYIMIYEEYHQNNQNKKINFDSNDFLKRLDENQKELLQKISDSQYRHDLVKSMEGKCKNTSLKTYISILASKFIDVGFADDIKKRGYELIKEILKQHAEWYES